MKATEQYYPVVPFCYMYVVQGGTFESFDEIPMSKHSTEIYNLCGASVSSFLSSKCQVVV